MRSRIKVALAAVLLAGFAGGIAPANAPSVADLDAAARAVGNRRDIAEQIGRAIFGTEWSAEVNQVSANEFDSHLIVGIRMWGVKFHHPLTREAFVDEVVTLTQKIFGAAPAAEEVDIWASVPIEVPKGEIVTGDLARPTSRTVFSLSVRHDESLDALRKRVLAGSGGVFWDPAWASTAFAPAA